MVVPWPLITELALEVQRHVLTSVQCCQALAGAVLAVAHAAPGCEHPYRAAALHESCIVSGAASDAATCLQELQTHVLDPVPTGLGTVVQACTQWVSWLQEHAELAAALSDYVCAAADALLDLRTVQPHALPTACAEAAGVTGAALFEGHNRFPFFGPDPVSLLLMATMMYTSSSSPVRSHLTCQALHEARQQQAQQQGQGQAILPAQAAEWLVLPEDDAAALRARASSLLQDRAFSQLDARKLAATG